MVLSKRLEHHFPSAIRDRGESYFQMGRVKIDHSEAGSHLFAWVSGSGDSSYTVELGWTGSSLVAECSCPYFETGKGMCKHVWAVILSIEEQNLFTGLVGEGSSKLPLCTFEEELFSPHSLEGDEDLTEEFFDGEDQEYQGRRERSIPVSEPGSDWTASIEKIDRYMQGTFIRLAEKEANARQLTYAISVQDCLSRNGLFVSILTQKRKQNGEWSVGKSQKISQAFLSGLVHEDDIQIVSLVRGAAHDEFPYTGFDTGMDPYVKIDSSLFSTLFKKICQTGRASICREWTLPATGLVWEETPWEFTLELQPEEAGKKFFRVCGSFKRESEILPIEAPLLLLADGLLFWENRVAPLKDHGAFVWITELRRTHSLEIPSEQKEKFFSKLVNLPLSPPMDVPEELSMKTLFPEPKISVMIRSERGSSPSVQKERLFAELLFSYGGKKAFLSDEQRAFLLFEKKEILYRDFNEEKNAYDFLLLAGCRPPAQNRFWQIKKGMLEVPKGKFTVIVSKLLEKGWKVEAEGKAYKTSGNFDLSVRSGIDWFDISGQIDFEGYRATLPEILKAAKKGSKFITLDDGSFGMLPEKWVQQYGSLSQLGEAKGDKFRFKKNQIGFLDILLSSKPEVKTDRGFKEFREKIRKFSGVKPKSPSPLFQGTLRGYQKEGLGWLFFLREFGLGGCLADDMGLGKTIQVLALLQMVHGEKENGSATNLVVVPSSLLFNWKEEAGRFTPDLRIFLHGGPGRKKPGEHFKEFDLVLTTYGTLRSDILLFQEIPFHYVILDEAQAIKNSNSQTSKSVRLLQAAHRLALSGTPIENHVGELWSLFEFLNPGILGKKTGFKRGTAAKKTGLEERRILAGAVKPFILRRTKEVVATDLPQKTEQTIYCEMKPSQRKVYEELKKHYQFSLVKNVKEKGVDTNRFQILEALLRLRQVACHPALIKDEMAKTSSCKLDTLRESLKEVVEEGHKALVFSQFTSFLALVKKELDKDGIKYQYLDGSTRDRQERVELFQNDESYSLFLISLRAGGVGLNLTRAEYVFILDPWWNPAVEAQAIDRAHRIGQTRNIFAYRLICKDTVEERVLALQKGKKELADSIISEDKSVLQGLQVEDLEFLLS